MNGHILSDFELNCWQSTTKLMKLLNVVGYLLPIYQRHDVIKWNTMLGFLRRMGLKTFACQFDAI